MTVYFEYLVQLSTYGKITHYYVYIHKFLNNYLLPIAECDKAPTGARTQTGCAGEGRAATPRRGVTRGFTAAISKFSSSNTELTSH